MKTLTFQISDDAYELLLKINEVGYAEYRDTEYMDLDEFKKSDLYIENLRAEEWFLNRNFGGTYRLANELCDVGLIKIDDMSWHLTFVISSFGKEILKYNDKIE